jgi:hypothetical protein
MITPFIFLDGNTIYSYDGTYIQLTEDDIKNYNENKISYDEVKSMAYSYLTHIPLNEFNYGNTQTTEL